MRRLKATAVFYQHLLGRGIPLTTGYAFRLLEEQTDGGVPHHPAVRFPLTPLDAREWRHWLTRLGIALLR